MMGLFRGGVALVCWFIPSGLWLASSDLRL